MRNKRNNYLIYLSHAFLFPLFIFAKAAKILDKYTAKFTDKSKKDVSHVDYW